MQLRWPKHIILTLLFLFLSSKLPACLSQTPPAPPIGIPPSASPDIQKLQDQLASLTDSITQRIAEQFSFCVSKPEKDWNDTFGYSSDATFLSNCLAETQGDLSTRICSQAEIRFYFSLFSGGQLSKFLKPNENCNLTSWVSGCEPGWACSAIQIQNQTLTNDPDYDKVIPARTTNCQPCCEGFFCPRGITCMIPCPLGAYCPVAEFNGTTGICDPYDYQVPMGNGSSKCGTANMWADVGSTESMFCPSGFYCPSTVEKLNCTDGHFCRLGSTSQSKCLFKSSCDPNSEKENLVLVGAFFMFAMCVLLLIFYNFSGIYLRIRERRETKSRETAAERARETVQASQQARQRWTSAKDIAKNVARLTTQISRSFSRRRISISHEEPKEEPATLLSKHTELSDAPASTTKKKKKITNIYDNIELIQEDVENNINNKEKKGKEEASKGKKHVRTRTAIFQNAYIEIEKEKAFQKEHKDLTFSEVFSQASRENVVNRPLLEVAFKDLTLTLGKKKLLRSITGKLLPGKVTAVMGPSGAGKTTFLNAVAGKIVAGCKVSGSVLVNGKVGNIRSYKKIIGFVPQDDIVHGDLTVEENLWFSARCRLSKRMPVANKILVVERVIESLGLQGIRNSLVGTVEKRGISGGQRKRVNVGLEMVMEPSLLILDEPTSGLDSASSQLLLRALRREALEGVNIAAVIHQPSYTLYRMFDDLILLAKGGFTVYHGSIEKVEGYFSLLGLNVPDRVNPPDYFIDVLEGIEKPNSKIDIKHLPLQWMLYNGYDVPKDMRGDLEELDSSNRGGELSSVRSESGGSFSDGSWENVKYSNNQDTNQRKGLFRKSNDLTNRNTPGVLKQYRYYLGRVVKQRLRDAQGQAIDYLILGLAGTCLGIIARLRDTNFGIPGYIYTIIAISLLCKIAALRSFSQDQLQFWRERASGMSSLAYFLSKDTIDHFNTIVKPVAYLSMFYFFNNPRSSFLDNFTVMVALVYCVTGVGYSFAICFKPGSAQLWAALLPIVLTLLSTQSGTPRFLANLCYPKWALEAFVIANARRYSGVWLITRCAVLYRSQYDIKNWGLCIAILFLYGLLFRIIAFVCLVLLQKR
ncbi:ABC transporter family protein [Rhynchospora pubera]|uniref:ABC transporter family protein n=1 Tax=Rhynchospora pubera TaxID=906938 RepID=A0AAV8BVJ4_9POAL|nr:ABC transporter family protein [Rhynchospora pubera]